MRFLILAVLIILIGITVLPDKMYARETDDSMVNRYDSSRYGWLYTGYGLAGNKHDGGRTGIVGFTYIKNNSKYTGRLLFSDYSPENYPDPGAVNTVAVSEVNSFLDAGILYGYALGNRYVKTSASAGVSLLIGSVPGGNNTVGSITAGIPLELDFFLTPLPVLGFGIVGYANINYVSPVFGYLVCIQIGKVW